MTCRSSPCGPWTRTPEGSVASTVTLEVAILPRNRLRDCFSELSQVARGIACRVLIETKRIRCNLRNAAKLLFGQLKILRTFGF